MRCGKGISAQKALQAESVVAARASSKRVTNDHHLWKTTLKPDPNSTLNFGAR